ncbi:hypothetical protein ADL03_41870 [Nocardia sp. NRRL S-836]|nr:hypothetical protein ADL03_41870 [Nocardia sp. NRRL S-836]
MLLRPDAAALHDRIRALETRLPVLRNPHVMTNNLGSARGPRWVVPAAATTDTATGESLCDVEVELTAPVRLAIDAGGNEFTREAITSRSIGRQFGELAKRGGRYSRSQVSRPTAAQLVNAVGEDEVELIRQLRRFGSFGRAACSSVRS